MVKVIGLVLVLAMAGVGAVVVAQDDSAPDLVIFYGEDIWTLAGGVGTELQPHAFCGTSFGGERRWSPLIVSPDGRHLAYLTLPSAYEGFNGAVPTNVRLCHGGEQVDMVAGPQPDGASLDPSAPDFDYNAQSVPVWSPDGQWLAWTVLHTRDGDAPLELVAYEVATGALRSVTRDLPEQFGIPTPIDVAWTGAGLWVHVYVSEADGSGMALLLYSLEGELLDRFAAPADVDRVDDFFGVDDGGQEALAVMDSQGLIHLLTPATGEWRMLDGALQLYVPDASPDSLVINYSLGDNGDGIWGNDALWEIVSPDGAVERLDHGDIRTKYSIAIAPDGQAVAYGTYQAFVWREGEITTLHFPNEGDVMPDISLVWAPPAWRVVED